MLRRLKPPFQRRFKNKLVYEIQLILFNCFLKLNNFFKKTQSNWF